MNPLNASWQRPYDAYLFDLDGTLIDTVPDLSRALNACLAHAGLAQVDESLARHWVGHGARVMIREALAHHDADGDAEALFHVFIDHYQANIACHSAPYPSVVDTLDTLRQRGAKLAVITNKLEGLSRLLLAELELDAYFDLIVGGDTASAPKPDAAPVRLCLERLGVAAADALFVGDSETDVNAARAAGTPVVCVRDGYNQGRDVNDLRPDGVIDLFEELLLSR